MDGRKELPGIFRCQGSRRPPADEHGLDGSRLEPGLGRILFQFSDQEIHIAVFCLLAGSVLEESAVQAFGLAEGNVEIGHLGRPTLGGSLEGLLPYTLGQGRRDHFPLHPRMDHPLPVKSQSQRVWVFPSELEHLFFRRQL